VRETPAIKSMKEGFLHVLRFDSKTAESKFKDLKGNEDYYVVDKI
jgi:hypothetical protein